MQRSCRICDRQPVTKVADALIASGEGNAGISEALKAIGVTGVGVLTIQNHREKCRGGSVVKARFAAGQQKRTDFAAMVRDEATRLMEAGELSVTTQHGLQAQQMLDARETKEKDRVLMVSIARMLAGGSVPDSLVIVGTPYEEIESGFDREELEMMGS